MVDLIVVDARSLALPHTGVGRYALELLRHMPEHGDMRGVVKPGVVTEAGSLHVQILGPAVLDAVWNETALIRSLRSASGYWATNAQVPWRRTRGCRIVSVVHDLVHRDLDAGLAWQHRWSRENAVRASVARSDVIVTTNEHISRQLRTNYGRGADILIPPGPTMPPASELEVQALRDELSAYTAKHWVLAVGTESPRKNHARLADAVALLPGVGLAIVGGPGPGAQSRQPHVLRTGFASQDRLAAWYAVADVLAYPSLVEGFGLPLMDARRVGLPLVSSDRSPMREVAGPLGVLVDPTSVTSIRNGLSTALAKGRHVPEALPGWLEGALVLDGLLRANS